MNISIGSSSTLRILQLLLAVCVTVFVEGCHHSPPATDASLRGKATLKGTPPLMPGLKMNRGCVALHATPPKYEVVVTGPDGGLANVFVQVRKGIRGNHVPPEEPVLLEHRGCIYRPHVIGIQIGQLLRVTNSDPFLHNVHILSSPAGPEFNRAQPKGSPALKVIFTGPHVGVSVKCDVHPYALAYACVVDHPFFAVTEPDGAFEIPKKLPAGTYTITAWHERSCR